jgi:ABC-type nitrate/sulfonate/bicarbonate transport system substrate-binding protein
MPAYLRLRSLTKPFLVLSFAVCIVLGAYRGVLAERWVYGYGSVGEGMWPLLVAQQKGFFARNGIAETEFVLIEGGLRGMSALLGGDVHLMQTGGAPAIQAILKGAPLVILGSITNVLFFDFLVPKDIAKPADLRGKRIAISQFGSTTDLATQLVLKQFGISPKEVVFLQIGSNPARMAALLNGQIQGALLNSASHSPQAQQQGLKVLASLPEMGIELLQSSIITTKAFRKSQEVFLARFFKAVVESIAWLRNEQNKQEALKILGRFIRSQDQSLLQRTYDLSSKAGRPNPLATETGLRNILDFVSPGKPGDKTVAAENFLDNSFLQQLDSSGYIKSLYGK